MKNVRYLWLFLLVGLSGLWATEPVPRTFRVVTIGLSQTDFLYDSGSEKGLPILSYQGAFSKICTAPSRGTLSLYRMVEPPASAKPGTKPTKEILAEIAYPHDAEKTIVLLYPSEPNAPFPISGQVIDDSLGEHKPGMARVINLSSLKIAFTTAKDISFAPPRTLQLVVPFTSGNCHLKMAAESGGWREVMDIQRNLPASLRLFVVVVDAQPIEGGPPLACTLVQDFVRAPMTFVKQPIASP